MEKISNSEEEIKGSLSRHAKSLRHSDSLDPASPEYPSLTKKGVEQAREATKTELWKMLNEAPAGIVLFIGPKSDQERTAHTAEVYGEELKKMVATNPEILVFTKQDIELMRSSTRGKKGNEGSVLASLRQRINENQNKKIVITYPLHVKQLAYSFQERWSTKGKKTEYFDLLLKKHNDNHAKAVHEWIREEGRLVTDDGRMLQGPTPDDIAKQYIEGLRRTYLFLKKQLGNRPILIHGTGHQWDLDAVATYLAKGKVTYQNFIDVMGRSTEDINKHPIGESEVISNIEIHNKTGKATLTYRGKKYNTSLEGES